MRSGEKALQLARTGFEGTGAKAVWLFLGSDGNRRDDLAQLQNADLHATCTRRALGTAGRLRLSLCYSMAKASPREGMVAEVPNEATVRMMRRMTDYRHLQHSGCQTVQFPLRTGDRNADAGDLAVNCRRKRPVASGERSWRVHALTSRKAL